MSVPLRKLLWTCILVLPLWLTGCAVMDKDDCLSANWYDLGRIDALRGSYRAEDRAKACAEHQVFLDSRMYDQGVQEGLRSFCTLQSGRLHGQNGGSYQRGFCPAHTESAFLAGYLPAREHYQWKQRVEQLQKQMEAKNKSLSHELGLSKPDSRKIAQLRNDLKQLQHELRTEMLKRSLH